MRTRNVASRPRAEARMKVAAFALALTVALCAGATKAQAGTQIDRRMKLEPGGRFILDTFAGSVSVMGSQESGADVVVTSNRDDIQRDIDFEFDDRPGDAEVHARSRNPWGFLGLLFSGLRLHYDVRVPKDTRVEIRTRGGTIKVFALAGDANLHTSGGAVAVAQVTGNVRASSSGGTIRAQVIHGDASLWTSGGGIEADAVDGALSAHTSGGWIRIHDVAGPVNAHTSGGWITAVFAKGDSSGGVLDTSGGWIDVKIDRAANLEIDASTSGGGVQSDLPLRLSHSFSRHQLRGTLGNGGALLSMHTSGGSIRINGL